MASTGAIRAGRAFVELFLDNNPLVRGLNASSARLKSWGAGIASVGTKISAIGAAAFTPLLTATKIFSDMGSDMLDLSQRTGVSVEALSQLGYAAEQSGTDMATLEGGMAKMSKHLLGAVKAGGSKSLQQLGLDAKQLLALSPEQAFLKIGDALSKVENPLLRDALAMDLFGKSGTQLLPMLANGAAGVRELMEEADALGLTMTKESAAAAETFGDKLSTLWKVIKMTIFQVGAAIEPILSPIVDTVTRIASSVIGWVISNKELVQTIFMVASAVLGIGSTIVGLGAILSTIGVATGALAATVSAAFTAIATTIGFLLSPIGLVIGALAGLGAYFLFATESGQQTIDSLSDGFNTVKDDATTAFGGIADALAAGDIMLAAQVLWSFLKLEWARGVDSIQATWEGFTGFFVELYHGAVNKISEILVHVTAGWKQLLVNPWEFAVETIWNLFFGMINRVISQVQGLMKIVLYIPSLFSDSVQTFSDKIDAFAEKAKEHVDEFRAKGIEAQRKTMSDEDQKAYADIDRDRDDTLGTLREQQNAEAAKRAQDRQKRIAQATADVTSAQNELKDLRGKARDVAEKAEREKPALKEIKAPTFSVPDLSKLEKKTKEADLQAAGTFSAAIAGRVGARDFGKQQLDAIKEGNIKLGEIADNTEDANELG